MNMKFNYKRRKEKMKLNIRVIDYTTMNLKELQKEYTKEAQILLDM